MKNSNLNELSIKEVESKMLTYRGQKVLLDRDVADFYGVETKRVNEAVKNNPDKFPDGYVIELDDKMLHHFAVEIFDRKTISAKNRVPPKIFTERGIYMLATILKSPRATKATLAIIEAYADLRELAANLQRMSKEPDEIKRDALASKTGKVLSTLLSKDLSITEEEFTIELNLMAIKLSKKVKKAKPGK